MNYRRHYDALIDRARGRALSGYRERHHIVPRCMGGSNDRENLVDLTPEEHYVAHQLLVRMHPGNHKLIWALSAMSGGNRKQIRNNKRYGWIRRAFAKMLTERRFSDEHRARLSAASRGRKKSEAHCVALAAAKLGTKRKPHSEETKARMRASQRLASKTRDREFLKDPDYRERQRENMRRVWAERHARGENPLRKSRIERE